MIKNKNFKIISTVFVIGTMILWIAWTEYKSYSLRENFLLAIGEVTGITKETYKSKSKSILYTYEVNGTKYSGENGINSCKEMTPDELRLLLVNKQFPVAYEKSNIKNASIIVTLQDAEIYNCKLTDMQKQIDSILTCK